MRKIALIALLLMSAVSCELISSLIHDDEVVARVGDNKLYIAEVQKYIPNYVSSEDSINLALQYINKWASDLLYLDMAESQLSKEEMDVSKELEDYRRSLLRYRYEQRYVNDRLDTLVTDSQVEDYYQQHQSSFKLERPVVRYRFIDIPKNCPDRDLLLRKMCSDDYDDIDGLDTLAARSALKYYDKSEEWTDILVLAKEFGVNYKSLLSDMSRSRISISNPDSGEEKVAFVCGIQNDGIAPIEYCATEIRGIIQNARKRELLVILERDLLKDALDHQKFVIY